jgi:hypothetical protein
MSALGQEETNPELNPALKKAADHYMERIRRILKIEQEKFENTNPENTNPDSKISQANHVAEKAYASMLERLQMIRPDQKDQTLYDLAMKIKYQYEIAKSSLFELHA